MFDMFDALREIARVAEWTGLSVGVLLALFALAWFVPQARALALAIACTVLVGCGALIYGNHIGRAEVKADWDAANNAAAKVATAHDEAIGARIKAEYMPQLAALQKQSDQYQAQVTAYERTIIGAKSAAAAGRCQLGSGALRLRQPVRKAWWQHHPA